MKVKEMTALTNHFDKYFKQNNSMVLHPIVMEPHIDVLMYAPNEGYPYWKLVTMGASDYRMPVKNAPIGDRNEYIMFIDPSQDLNDEQLRNRYVSFLLDVASYPVLNKCYVSYGHCIEWGKRDGEEMVCAFLEMPQMMEDPGVLRCKLGLTKKTACLHVVLLNQEELNQLVQMGPQQFSGYLFPGDSDVCHFICELHRTDRF